MLWIAFLIPFQAQRRVALWRWGVIAFALLVFGLIGAPSYLAAIGDDVGTRETYAPPIFHPGWQLLSPAIGRNSYPNFPLCSNHMQLMCPSAIIGWFEIAVLAGVAFLVFAGSGAKRRYGLVIIALLALLHFYALLSMQTGSGPAACREHALSHVGLLSARAAGGDRGCGALLRRRITGRRARGRHGCRQRQAASSRLSQYSCGSG